MFFVIFKLRFHLGDSKEDHLCKSPQVVVLLLVHVGLLRFVGFNIFNFAGRKKKRWVCGVSHKDWVALTISKNGRWVWIILDEL